MRVLPSVHLRAGRPRACPSGGAALAICGLLAACATSPAGEPKVVKDLDIAPYSLHEECMHLNVGDHVDYDFISNYPVDFNVHYHDGNAILLPVSREKVYSDSGRFAPIIDHDYCLMWETGLAGALLDYRVAVRHATAKP